MEDDTYVEEKKRTGYLIRRFLGKKGIRGHFVYLSASDQCPFLNHSNQLTVLPGIATLQERRLLSTTIASLDL